MTRLSNLDIRKDITTILQNSIEIYAKYENFFNIFLVSFASKKKMIISEICL